MFLQKRMCFLYFICDFFKNTCALQISQALKILHMCICKNACAFYISHAVLSKHMCFSNFTCVKYFTHVFLFKRMCFCLNACSFDNNACDILYLCMCF